MKKIFLLLIIFFSFFCISASAQNEAYTSEELGFSIQYPDDYKLQKNYRTKTVTIIFPRIAFFDFFPTSISVAVQKTKPRAKPIEETLDIYYKYSKSVTDRGKTRIDNTDFLMAVQKKKILIWDVKMYHLIAAKGLKVYNIIFIATTLNYDKRLEEAKKIINSFKFIEN